MIGRGAHGHVYKAEELAVANAPFVAVKLIKSKICAGLKQSIAHEVTLLRKLQHPNIVKYIDSVPLPAQN